MRIFNWVHRRFIPKDEQKLRKDDDDKHKDGILQLMNAGEEGDTKALLFDKNSNDGDYHAILSIGTFGQHDDQYRSSSSFESWDDDDEDGIVEAGDDECDDDHPLLYASSSSPDPAAAMNIVAAHVVEEEDDEGDEISMMEMRKKERTTLAELFSAESKVDQPKAASTSTAPKHDIGSLFVKKKSSSKQDSRPIQKLHGLMKRMLKRKIHPAADFSDPSSQLHPFPFNINTSLSHHHPHPDAATHEQQEELWT